MKTQKGFKRFTALFLTFAVIATLVSSFTFGVSAKEDNDTSAGQLTYVFTPITVNIGTYADSPGDEYEAEEGVNAIEFLSTTFSEAAAYEKTGWELVRGGMRSYVTEDTVLCDGDTYYMIWGLASDGVLGILGTCTADMFEDIEYNSYVMSDYGGVLDIYHTIDGVEYRFAVDPVNFTIGDIFPLMDIDTSKTYTVNGVEVSYRDQLPLKSTAFETLATGSITVELYVESDRAQDMTRDFKFTVDLINSSVPNGKYGDMTFTNGVAEIVLKDGESITAEGLPANIGYVVIGETVEGFEINSHGATGDTTAQGVVASFVYTYKPYAIYTLVGTFTGWDPQDTSYDLTRNEDGKYVFETELDSGEHRFKVAKDHSWGVSLGAKTGDSNILTNGIAATVYEGGSDLAFTLDAKTVVTFTLDLEANTITVSWEEPTPSDDPVITDVSFNSGSDAYDSETNVFYLSDNEPFVITITGENLSKLQGNDLRALFFGDAEGSGGVIINPMVISDTSAQISINTYTLTYILSNAIGGGKESTKVKSVAIKLFDETVQNLYVNIEYKKNFTVEFVVESSIVSRYECDAEGEKISDIPNDPEKTDCKFIGWYELDDDGNPTIPLDTDKTYYDDVRFYAVFKEYSLIVKEGSQGYYAINNVGTVKENGYSWIEVVREEIPITDDNAAPYNPYFDDEVATFENGKWTSPNVYYFETELRAGDNVVVELEDAEDAIIWDVLLATEWDYEEPVSEENDTYTFEINKDGLYSLCIDRHVGSPAASAKIVRNSYGEPVEGENTEYFENGVIGKYYVARAELVEGRTVESDPFLYNKVKKLHYFVKLNLERMYEHSIITDDELGFTSGGVIKILDEDGKAVYTVDEEDENIDEDDYGYTVICVRGELPKGKYTVIFEKPGYVTLSEEILIEKNANNYEFTPICGDIRGSYEEHLGDGKVDFDDFIRVLRGINENSSELLRLAVDLNEDGIVNVNDLAIIKASIAAE